ncbi:hypothetical protein ACQP3L_35650, partial [Escherichia coli]
CRLFPLGDFFGYTPMFGNVSTFTVLVPFRDAQGFLRESLEKKTSEIVNYPMVHTTLDRYTSPLDEAASSLRAGVVHGE